MEEKNTRFVTEPEFLRIKAMLEIASRQEVMRKTGRSTNTIEYIEASDTFETYKKTVRENNLKYARKVAQKSTAIEEPKFTYGEREPEENETFENEEPAEVVKPEQNDAQLLKSLTELANALQKFNEQLNSVETKLTQSMETLTRLDSTLDANTKALVDLTKAFTGEA